MVDAQEQPLREIPEDPGTLVKENRPKSGYYPSPDDWRTECIYFLLPDRFDDGCTAEREPLGHERRFVDWQPGPDSALTKLYWNYWAISGRNRFQGGTLNGIRKRLPYLRDLGVTAIWLAPVFRQRAAGVDANQCGDGTDDAYWPPQQQDLAKDYQNENYREVQTPRDDYHGYAIQNFLDVDPRFGTIADLRKLVKKAHKLKLKVIYDIVINHAAECFAYEVSGALNPIRPPFLPEEELSRHYGFDRWLDAKNRPKDWPKKKNRKKEKRNRNKSLVDLDDGVWPKDLQHENLYSRRGLGSYGSDDEVEYRGSDYRNRDFDYPWEEPATAAGERPTCPALEAMVKIWTYWIVLTDCDGFRVDTYKHVPEWVSMEFSRRVREFADVQLGKRKFLIMGEIGGAEVQAARYLRQPELRLLSLDGRRGALRALAGGDAKLAARVLTPSIDKLNGFEWLSKEHQDEVRANIRAGSGGIDPLATEDKATEDKATEDKAIVDKLIVDKLIRDRFVMSIDDHDGLGIPELRRIAGTYGTHAVLPAAAFLLFGPGIPCLYYGTEQALTGPPLERANDKWQQQILGNLSDYGWNDRRRGGDRYLREAMFGPEFPLAAGPDGREREAGGRDGRIRQPDLGLDRRLPGFGPMGTSGRHAFDPTSPWYKGISALAGLRRDTTVLATGDITIVNTGRVDRGRYGVGLPEGLIVWTKTADDGQFGLIVVNLTTDSQHAVSHRIEVGLPSDRLVRQHVRILGERSVEIGAVVAKRTLRANTGLCYLKLGIVEPGEIRVYLAE